MGCSASSANKPDFGTSADQFAAHGTKPLGTGCLPDPNAQCTGTPVKEFRAAVVRPFKDGRLSIGLNMLVASGHTGQTIENFLPSDVSEVVGVRIPSYASIALTYRFGSNNKHYQNRNILIDSR